MNFLNQIKIFVQIKSRILDLELVPLEICCYQRVNAFICKYFSPSSHFLGRGMTSDIVITGLAGRFPECDNVDELRDKLFAGVDLVTEDDRRWPMGECRRAGAQFWLNFRVDS